MSFKLKIDSQVDYLINTSVTTKLKFSRLFQKRAALNCCVFFFMVTITKRTKKGTLPFVRVYFSKQ